MQLTGRLFMNISIAEPCNVLADVGCDHAYISIFAIENEIAKKAIAMDLRKGPLSKAKANIEERGLQSKIDTRLGNGLEALKPDEADAILISGMGGITICQILDEGLDKLGSVKQLILQPQSDLELVRRKIEELGMHIESEKMCIEDGKFYTCMKAVPERASSYNNESDYTFGRLLIEEKNEVLRQFLIKRNEKIMQIKKQIKESGTDASLPQNILDEEIKIREALDRIL
jgi:tRNA (adenine22-N1)-methyltransferase